MKLLYCHNSIVTSNDGKFSLRDWFQVVLNIFPKSKIIFPAQSPCQRDANCRAQIKEQFWNFALVQSFL